MPPETDPLKRIAALEQRCAGLMFATVISTTAAFCALGVGGLRATLAAFGQPANLVVKSLVVRSESSGPEIVITHDEGIGVISIRDKDHANRVLLGGGDNPSLMLMDGDNRSRVAALITRDGDGYVTVKSADGQRAAHLEPKK